MPFCNSGPSLYSQQDILYYNAFADASIFFTFHSPLYSRLRSAKENRCRPSADGMPVSRATRRKPFFSSCSSSFSSSSENPSGHKTPAVSLSGKAADIFALCFHTLLKRSRKLQNQQIMVIKQIFLFPDLLSSEIKAYTIACHACQKIMRPGRRFLFFIACAGNLECIFQKVRPPLGCPHQRGLMAPCFDLFVVTGKKHLRNFFLVPCLRSCVMRILKQVVLQ